MNKLTPLSSGLALTKTARALVIATILSTLIASSLQAQQNSVPQRRLDPEERTNVSVFKQASPSVVNICTKQALTARSGDVILDLGRIPKGSGSGFIWDASGHVVTNYHVIQGADAVQVTLGRWN